MAYRSTSPPRYALQRSTAAIPLLWGNSCEPLAHLPQSTIRTFLPNLHSSHRDYTIDVRNKLLSAPQFSTHDHCNYSSVTSPERYRKAATAVIHCFEALAHPDPSSRNPISRFLENKVVSEVEEEGESEGGKTLRAVNNVLYVSRVFGCLPSLRIVLEHFLLTFGRELSQLCRDASDHNEWREVISEISPHGPVRNEIESRFTPLMAVSSPPYTPGYVIGTELNSSEYSTRGRAGRGFENTLASSPELGQVWRSSRSIFAAVSPDVLQGLLGSLGSGSTLVPPSATADGELLDPRGDTVFVEIRKLDPGRGGMDGRLRQRVGDWLMRGQLDGGRRRDVMW